MTLATRGKRPLDGGPSFALRIRVVRAVWIVAWAVLASWTPPALWPWRRLVLRVFGATVGVRSDVRGSSKVWYPPHLIMGERALIGPGVTCYNQAPITLESHSLVSQGAHLCTGTHRIDDPDFPLVARPIRLCAHVWVAAEAFVGPGVTVGEGAVLGARGVALHDLEPWGVYSGNPASKVRMRARC